MGMSIWHQANGNWQLATGNWQPATGIWHQANGNWLQLPIYESFLLIPSINPFY